MNINEVLKEESLSKQYKVRGLKGIWIVKKKCDTLDNGYDLYNEQEECITKFLLLTTILGIDFEEIVDWTKVKIDTLIKVRDKIEDKWIKRYFAKYENGFIYVWENGATSFTTDNENRTRIYKYARVH